MRIILFVVLIGLCGTGTLPAQEGDHEVPATPQPEKKEAVELNVYEATFTGLT